LAEEWAERILRLLAGGVTIPEYSCWTWKVSLSSFLIGEHRFTSICFTESLWGCVNSDAKKTCCFEWSGVSWKIETFLLFFLLKLFKSKQLLRVEVAYCSPAAFKESLMVLRFISED
jgi:hypothetical protein